jgi:hypothetical protein
MGVIAGAAVMGAAFGTAPAFAQATNEQTGLPYCSASVRDRCIQRVDVRRLGGDVKGEKAEAYKAAAANKPM